LRGLFNLVSNATHEKTFVSWYIFESNWIKIKGKFFLIFKIVYWMLFQPIKRNFNFKNVTDYIDVVPSLTSFQFHEEWTMKVIKNSCRVVCPVLTLATVNTQNSKFYFADSIWIQKELVTHYWNSFSILMQDYHKKEFR
jgi:hypothetical protein